MLAEMQPPEFPMAMGVLYRVQESTYEEAVLAQVEDAKANGSAKDLDALLRGGATWTV